MDATQMDPNQYTDAAGLLSGARNFDAGAQQVQAPPSVDNAPLNNRTAPAMPQPTAPPPPKKTSLVSDILRAVGDVLGGPSTHDEVDPTTGEIKHGVPFSRSQRIANTAGIYLRGAAAGAAQHGPAAIGKAALAGVNEQQQTQQQQQENTLEQSKNVQAQLRGKASDALINQQITESGFRMAREGTAIDEATAEK